MKGYNTKIITLKEIYANYSGHDNPEKIRNCIKDYYSIYNQIIAPITNLSYNYYEKYLHITWDTDNSIGITDNPDTIETVYTIYEYDQRGIKRNFQSIKVSPNFAIKKEKGGFMVPFGGRVNGLFIKGRGSFNVDDIDNDGKEEILGYPVSDNLYLIDENGNILWHREFPYGSSYYTAPLVGDFNGDGEKEIINLSGGGIVYMLDKI